MLEVNLVEWVRSGGWREPPAGGIAAVVEQRQHFALFCYSSLCSLSPRPPQCLHPTTPLAPLLAGKEIDPCRVESAVPTGRHLGFSLICFLISVLPLGKHEPGVNLCFAGRGSTCQDLFQDGFFAVHWGWSGDIMEGECSLSAGLNCDANTYIAKPSLSMWCLS